MTQKDGKEKQAIRSMKQYCEKRPGDRRRLIVQLRENLTD